MESDQDQRKPERYACPLPSAPKLRAFQPNFRQRILTRIAETFDLSASEQLPAYFQQNVVYTAKIGLAKDMAERFGGAQDENGLSERRKALNLYFRCFHYHQAILQCTDRVDPELRPAGLISPDKRARTMKALFDMKRRKAKENPPTHRS